MPRYLPKQGASKQAPDGVVPWRQRFNPLKTKAVFAPTPDPRLVPGGIPGLSYLVALIAAVGLVVCAHMNNAAPTPGDGFALRAASPSSPPISAQALNTVLSAAGPACALTPGGQNASSRLAVLAHRPDGVVLSLAGAYEAAPHACPADTPLLVSQADYETLRN